MLKLCVMFVVCCWVGILLCVVCYIVSRCGNVVMMYRFVVILLFCLMFDNVLGYVIG